MAGYQSCTLQFFLLIICIGTAPVFTAPYLNEVLEQQQEAQKQIPLDEFFQPSQGLIGPLFRENDHAVVPPSRGVCHYQLRYYEEGERIDTKEPCLNCTCHNSMLMCYLKVCPFSKPIGKDCTVEKSPDQCCPVITCPQVPVNLQVMHMPSATSTSAPISSTTALAPYTEHGCSIEGQYYPDGAQVPGDPTKPCELCYCIRNHTACIMQECILKVEGCDPVFLDGICCPVRYQCAHDKQLEEITTTTVAPNGTLITTTIQPPSEGGCFYNNESYNDGEMIQSDNPCEHCYCMNGDPVCAIQECRSPLDEEDEHCVPRPSPPGQCCPEAYDCPEVPEITTVKYEYPETTIAEKISPETPEEKETEIGELPVTSPAPETDEITDDPEKEAVTIKDIETETLPTVIEEEESPVEGIDPTFAVVTEEEEVTVGDITLPPIAEEEKDPSVDTTLSPVAEEEEADMVTTLLPVVEEEKEPAIVSTISSVLEEDKEPAIKTTLSPAPEEELEPSLDSTLSPLAEEVKEPVADATLTPETEEEKEPPIDITVAPATEEEEDPALDATFALEAEEEKEPSLGTTLAPEAEEKPDIDTTLAPVAEEEKELSVDTTLSPVAEEEETDMDTTLSPVAEEEKEPAIDTTLSPFTEDEIKPLIGTTPIPVTEEEKEPLEGETLTPVTEEIEKEPTLDTTLAPVAIEEEPAVDATITPVTEDIEKEPTLDTTLAPAVEEKEPSLDSTLPPFAEDEIKPLIGTTLLPITEEEKEHVEPVTEEIEKEPTSDTTLSPVDEEKEPTLHAILTPVTEEIEKEFTLDTTLASVIEEEKEPVIDTTHVPDIGEEKEPAIDTTIDPAIDEEKVLIDTTLSSVVEEEKESFEGITFAPVTEEEEKVTAEDTDVIIPMTTPVPEEPEDSFILETRTSGLSPTTKPMIDETEITTLKSFDDKTVSEEVQPPLDITTIPAVLDTTEFESDASSTESPTEIPPTKPELIDYPEEETVSETDETLAIKPETPVKFVPELTDDAKTTLPETITVKEEFLQTTELSKEEKVTSPTIDESTTDKPELDGRTTLSAQVDEQDTTIEFLASTDPSVEPETVTQKIVTEDELDAESEYPEKISSTTSSSDTDESKYDVSDKPVLATEIPEDITDSETLSIIPDQTSEDYDDITTQPEPVSPETTETSEEMVVTETPVSPTSAKVDLITSTDKLEVTEETKIEGTEQPIDATPVPSKEEEKDYAETPLPVDVDISSQDLDTTPITTDSPAEEELTTTPKETIEDKEEEITLVETEPSALIIDGNCDVNGTIYSNGAEVPVLNSCQEQCMCKDSIVTCQFRACPSPPPAFLRCDTVQELDDCCPIYNCETLQSVDVDQEPSPNCKRDGVQYYEGDYVPSKDICTDCYCTYGEIVCGFIECPKYDEGCKPIEIPKGSCCPTKYECPELEVGDMTMDKEDKIVATTVLEETTTPLSSSTTKIAIETTTISDETKTSIPVEEEQEIMVSTSLPPVKEQETTGVSLPSQEEEEKVTTVSVPSEKEQLTTISTPIEEQTYEEPVVTEKIEEITTTVASKIPEEPETIPEIELPSEKEQETTTTVPTEEETTEKVVVSETTFSPHIVTEEAVTDTAEPEATSEAVAKLSTTPSTLTSAVSEIEPEKNLTTALPATSPDETTIVSAVDVTDGSLISTDISTESDITIESTTPSKLPAGEVTEKLETEATTTAEDLEISTSKPDELESQTQPTDVIAEEIEKITEGPYIPDVEVSTTPVASPYETTTEKDVEADMIAEAKTTEVPYPIITDVDDISPDAVTTQESIIPGEGNCLINGTEYINGESVPKSSPCQEDCTCKDSVVTCQLTACPAPPPAFLRCELTEQLDECCPSYECPVIEPGEEPSPKCKKDGVQYFEGDFVPSADICTDCYCLYGDIVCATLECPPMPEGCIRAETEPGNCCPTKYECPDDLKPEDHTVMTTTEVDTSEIDSSTDEPETQKEFEKELLTTMTPVPETDYTTIEDLSVSTTKKYTVSYEEESEIISHITTSTHTSTDEEQIGTTVASVTQFVETSESTDIPTVSPVETDKEEVATSPQPEIVTAPHTETDVKVVGDTEVDTMTSLVPDTASPETQTISSIDYTTGKYTTEQEDLALDSTDRIIDETTTKKTTEQTEFLDKETTASLLTTLAPHVETDEPIKTSTSYVSEKITESPLEETTTEYILEETTKSKEEDTQEIEEKERYKKCHWSNKTYEHGASVPPESECQDFCKCDNGTVKCKHRACPTVPPTFLRCATKTSNDTCCPVYDCGEPEPTDTFCLKDGMMFNDGDYVPSGTECLDCYCHEGEIVCASLECGVPRAGCKALVQRNSDCCPILYECDETPLEVEEFMVDPESVTDSDATVTTDLIPEANMTTVGETSTKKPSVIVSSTPIKTSEQPLTTLPADVDAEVTTAKSPVIDEETLVTEKEELEDSTHIGVDIESTATPVKADEEKLLPEEKETTTAEKVTEVMTSDVPEKEIHKEPEISTEETTKPSEVEDLATITETPITTTQAAKDLIEEITKLLTTEDGLLTKLSTEPTIIVSPITSTTALPELKKPVEEEKPEPAAEKEPETFKPEETIPEEPFPVFPPYVEGEVDTTGDGVTYLPPHADKESTTWKPTTTTELVIGPGNCLFDSKVYASAEQIPRDDPCDFCFCFRGDIICLQQTCPDPIYGCYEEAIPGFCCPRYECPVRQEFVNITTTTPSPFPGFPPSYKTSRIAMCEIEGRHYASGEVVKSASSPCHECICGSDGFMKCIPKECDTKRKIYKYGYR